MFNQLKFRAVDYCSFVVSTKRSENRMERSGAWSGHGWKGWSGSGRSRSGNGAGSGGYRNRLERGAAFSPLTLRSRALIETNNYVCESCCTCMLSVGQKLNQSERTWPVWAQWHHKVKPPLTTTSNNSVYVQYVPPSGECDLTLISDSTVVKQFDKKRVRVW